MKFQSPLKDLFFSKEDPLDPRLGECFHFQPDAKLLKSGVVALIGYPDDEGIQKNGGRVGAAQGPRAVRHWLYRMTSPKAGFQGVDLGDLADFSASSLEDRHQLASGVVKQALRHGAKVIAVGGGHDYGFADGSAFLEEFSKQKPLIINFDAHLDVRDLSKGITSGTPFFRLKQLGVPFDLIQVGIQSQCNSLNHLKWCQENHIHVLSLEEFTNPKTSLLQVFQEKMKPLLTRRPTFLSVDIDGFSWPYAIGSSQSWPTGIEPREFFELFHWLNHHLDCRILSLYEISPPLDVQDGTAKLGAQIAYRFLERC